MRELMELSASWRKGDEHTVREFDVLSAFSMSYKGQPPARGTQLSRPVAELPPFPKAVQRRLTRKGPGDVNPWRKLAEASSQQDDTKNIRKTPEPACEHTDASEEEGYLLLSGASDGPTTTGQERWGMMPEKLQWEERRAECALRPTKRNEKGGR